MRVFKVIPVLAALLIYVGAPSAVAQTRILHEISFTGAADYSQADLLAVTGLKAGSSATQKQVEDAAQRLNDTGLFDEVNFTGNDKGIVYALKPAPSSAMLPVRFGNFVWWQDEEIEQTLKARVVLYRENAVPTSGNLRESISAALTAMVAEKGVAGATVASRLSSSRPGGPLNRLVFVIDSPAVLVHSLTLADASPAMQSKLVPVIRDMAGQQWDKDGSYLNIASRVGDVYHNEGFLDVAVAKQDHSAAAITLKDIELDLTATIHDSSGVDWVGSVVSSGFQ